MTGLGAFLFTLPNPVPALRFISPWRAAVSEPREGLAEAMGAVGFRVWFALPLELCVMGVPIDLPMSDVFLDARPLL